MAAFSIIVPIYNAEKTLRRCLDSLGGQTFSDFEVLMIENGSSDKSNEICRQYTVDDRRFILHTCRENVGPSGARNIGLENACGQWIAFVDSDDYVTPEYLRQLHQAFEQNQADVVFFGYHQISTDGAVTGVHIPQVPEEASYYEVLSSLSEQDMFGYTWIKAFRADTIGRNRFSMELNLLEDEVFACEILKQERRITILPIPIYYYVTGNAGSLIGRTHQDYCVKLDAAYRAWKNILADTPHGNEHLTKKANECVTKSMYYGFERDIDPDCFFRLMLQCSFFGDADLDTPFYANVRNGKWGKVRRMRNVYRLKVAVSKLLKRRGSNNE